MSNGHSNTNDQARGADATPFLSDQFFQSSRFVRRPPNLRGAARFIRRASSRGVMREPSMRVREAAAEQIEERQSDWAYSRPIVILDLVWNFAFVVVSVVVLILSRDESPSMPLRLWIVGYVFQCVLHMVCVHVEYKRRIQQRNLPPDSLQWRRGSGGGGWGSGDSNSSSSSDVADVGDYVSDRRQNADETRKGQPRKTLNVCLNINSGELVILRNKMGRFKNLLEE